MTEHPLDVLENYALRLLSPESEAGVSEHLARCAECYGRLLDIEQTLGLLAYSVPMYEPPDGTEERLLARVTALRQEERALRRSANASPEPLPEPVSATSSASSASSVRANVVPVPIATSPASQRHRGRLQLRRTVWPSRVVYGLVAAAAVLLVAVGTLGANLIATHSTNGQLQGEVRAQQTALALFGDPNTTIRQLRVSEPEANGAKGKMAMSPKTNQGVLVVSHLPQLAHDKTYQLWLVHDATDGTGAAHEDVIPVSTFRVDATGSAVISFTSSVPISTVSNAGISIEHSGGAAHPDSPMIMLLA